MMSGHLNITGLGRVLRGTPTPADPFGLFVTKNGLQGWQSLNGRRREALARAVSHGEHDVPVRLPSRVVTVDGVAIGRGLELLQVLNSRVSSWGATGQRFPLTVDHLGQVLTADVRTLLADVEDNWTRRQGKYVAKFQVQFVAADPRRYGELEVAPKAGYATSIPVSHRGNFPAHVVVEIPSAPAAYTVQTPVGTFTVSGALAGETHRIDTKTGRVTRDGLWMQGVGRGPLWAVPEGDTWVHTLSVPGRVLIQTPFI